MYLENLVTPVVAIVAAPLSAIRRLMRPDLVSFGLLANLQALSRRATFRGIDCIVDIGANRGQFAYMVSRAFPGVPIHSFEPYPSCAESLRETFTRHKIAGRVYEWGLGDREGTASLNAYQQDVNSSFLVRKGASDGKVVPVRVTTLDKVAGEEITGNTLFIKIDVQGFESQVLAGAVGTLRRCKYLLVELSFESSYEGSAGAGDVMSWLSAQRFRPVDLMDTLRAPQAEGGALREVDVLFANERLLGNRPDE